VFIDAARKFGCVHQYVATQEGERLLFVCEHCSHRTELLPLDRPSSFGRVLAFSSFVPSRRPLSCPRRAGITSRAGLRNCGRSIAVGKLEPDESSPPMARFRHPHLIRGIVRTPRGGFTISRGVVELPEEIGEELGWRRLDADAERDRAAVPAMHDTLPKSQPAHR